MDLVEQAPISFSRVQAGLVGAIAAPRRLKDLLSRREHRMFLVFF